MTEGPDPAWTTRVLIVAAVALATVFVGVALWKARTALMIVYISGLIAIGLTPVVDRVAIAIGRKGQAASRSVAALVVYLAAFLVLGGMMAFVAPAVVAQFDQLRDELPLLFRRMQQTLVTNGILRHPVTLQETLSNATVSTSMSLLTPVKAMLGVVGGLVGFVTIVFLSYYFVIDGRAMLDWALRAASPGRRPLLRTIACEVGTRVAAWLRANVLLGAIMGSAAAIFLGVTGTPFFYVAAAVAAFGEAVPVAGSFVAGVVAVGLAATKSMELAALVALFFFCLHEIEANVLVPRLMEKRVGVSSAALIIALLIGFELGGVSGVIVAVPTAAILAAVLEAVRPSTRQS